MRAGRTTGKNQGEHTKYGKQGNHGEGRWVGTVSV